jgi:hypothetical protein
LGENEEDAVFERQQMASALEVFDSAVFGAVFDAMSTKDGDASVDIVAVGLADVVEGLSPADALEFLGPQLARIVPDDDDPASMVVNDFWYRADTFGPIYYALARDFYERVRPLSYPSAPEATISESDDALFGCSIESMDFDGGCRGDGAAVLWAGCVVAAVRLTLQRSVALSLGYTLLFSYVRSRFA